MPDGTANPDTPAAARAAGQHKRPQYRNLSLGQLVYYRLPAAGLVSILHRISGALLFLVGIPYTLWLFQQSLRSEISFERYRAVVGSVPGKLVLLVLIWALAHHLVAGIRYLALDVHIGIDKQPATQSARMVLVGSLVLTLLFALRLFGFY